MTVHLDIRNESRRARLYRGDVLSRLADRILAEEGDGPDVELSVLFCDDPFITDLNRKYRRKNGPTDVLAFEQAQAHGTASSKDKGRTRRVLGDIVISLEAVARNCGGDRGAMREEVRLLFCHAMLHLLGYTHGTTREVEQMTAKQARYLARPSHGYGRKT